MKATVFGAGLAGCEAAYQLLKRGVEVTLVEMKPLKKSPAHRMDGFAELVCSNSLKSDSLTGASGVLKAELRKLDSLLIRCADKTSVPAGGALAVDRYAFSDCVTAELKKFPNLKTEYRVADRVADGINIIATGPLTDELFLEEIKRLCGRDFLYFFDAAAPLVSFDSIDMSRAWFASRYDRGESDYVNCSMERDEYAAFVEALTTAEEAEVHGFEDSKVFEGCMPVEVMARRGFDTLRYGPLKPVGLKDPKTGREPYAVVQLRKDNAEGSVYNLVGFQTHLKFPEQKRVFSMIPALHDAEFVRYGVMHRNTFLCSPKLLDRYYADRREPLVAFAGQMTGVEGYVESTASGYLAGVSMAAKVLGGPLPDFPRETAIGALAAYISDESVVNFQPMNVNFGIMPALGYRVKGKANKNLAIANRSLAVIDAMTGKTKEESHENSR